MRALPRCVRALGAYGFMYRVCRPRFCDPRGSVCAFQSVLLLFRVSAHVNLHPGHQPACCNCNLAEWYCRACNISSSALSCKLARMASRVAHGLNHRFQQGTPSGSIDRAGVVVRGFDKYTQGPGSHWLPGMPRLTALPPSRPPALPHPLARGLSLVRSASRPPPSPALPPALAHSTRPRTPRA